MWDSLNDHRTKTVRVAGLCVILGEGGTGMLKSPVFGVGNKTWCEKHVIIGYDITRGISALLWLVSQF